jgi:hypothetical protein
LADVDPKALCKQIIATDETIRVAIIVDEMGKIVATQMKKGLVPLLSEKERDSYAMKSALGKMTREEFESKLGRLIYSSSVYKKVKRIDIPLNRKGMGLLIVSFDISTNHEPIIFDKILPLLERILPNALGL